MNSSAQLQVQGESLLLTGDVFFENVMNICDQGCILMNNMKKIKVNPSGLKQFDSSVLALCIEWLRWARAQQKELTFVNLPTFMQDLVRVHGLEGVLPVADQNPIEKKVSNSWEN